MIFGNGSDADYDRAVVLALAHRLAALRAIRTTAIPAVLLFGFLSWHLGRWLPLLAAPIVIWIVSIVISNTAANKVQRLIGFSHQSQEILWKRYKSDPAFSAEVDTKLRDPNLTS
jgi:hypothetical protein